MLLIDLNDLKYHCPITLELFEYPIKTPCGHNFEAEHIYGWLEQHLNCPCCKTHLTFDELELNEELRRQIQYTKRALALEAALASVLKSAPSGPVIFSTLGQEQQDAAFALELAREFALLEEQERSDAAYARTLTV